MASAYTSQGEIQTYMYAQLMPANALDSTLAAAGLNAVYDLWAVPQNAAFDYMTIGDGYEIRKDTLGDEGTQHGYLYYPTLHIWSTQRGTQHAALMVSRLNKMFTDKDAQPWTLATLKHVYTMLKNCRYLPDAVGIIPVLHVALQYEIYTEQS